MTSVRIDPVVYYTISDGLLKRTNVEVFYELVLCGDYHFKRTFHWVKQKLEMKYDYVVSVNFTRFLIHQQKDGMILIDQSAYF